jgi:endoglucanase Acf2
MSCCGQSSRPLYTSPYSSLSSSNNEQANLAIAHLSSATSSVSSPSSNTIRFEYTGKTALTVLGPLTWKAYRFEHPGAQVEVDLEEAALLEVVPHLIRLSSLS